MAISAAPPPSRVATSSLKLAQERRLHLAVLEASKRVLQGLQRRHDRVDHGGRKQGGEELEQVSQLLALLAQVVQGDGRGRP